MWGGGINSAALAAVEIEEGAAGVTQAAYGIAAGDVVYFGNYPQSTYTPTDPPVTPAVDTTYTDADGTQFVYSNSQYFKIEPIAWQVLSNDGTDLFLLAQDALDIKPYNATGTDVTWKTSTLQTWLNRDFLTAAFSTEEQAAITTTEVINGSTSNPGTGVDGGDDTDDKVFLLSVAEARNAAYGFADNGERCAPLTAYAIAQGAYSYGANAFWWLRSPGGYGNNYAAYVIGDGSLWFYGEPVDYAGYSVRPALNLDLSSVLFTSAASGTSAKSASTVGNGFVGVQAPSGSVKFTVQDDVAQKLDVIGTTAQSTQSASTLTFSYENATTGTNQSVSAVLVNSGGDVAYYSKLADSSAGSSNALFIPLAGVADGTYTLKIFSEQANGDNYTDFASKPITMSVVVTRGTGTVQAGTFVTGGGILDDAPVLSALLAERTSDAAAGVWFSSTEAGTYYYQLDGTAPTAASLVSGGTSYSLASGTNSISFTSLAQGAHTLYIAAEDNTGNVSNLLTVPIPAYGSLLVPTITSVANTTVPYTGGTFQVTATANTPISYSLTSAPAGVSIDSASGLITITGTVTPGTYNFSVVATNATASDTQGFTLTVNPPAPVITSATSATFTIGTAESFTVTATNAPTSFSIGGDILPSGVSFNTITGTLTGTPATGTDKTYNLIVTATNAGGISAPQNFTLTVNPAPVGPTGPTITSSTSTTVPYTGGTFQVTATGDNPISYSLTSAPTGVSIDSASGLITITGTVTPGTYNFSVVATNATASDTQGFTLTVNPPAPVAKTALSVALTTANSIAQGAYTTVAWTDFAAARTAVTTVLNNASATQAEVDAATATLNAAYSALKVTDNGHRFENNANKYTKGSTTGLIHIANHDWSLHTAVVKVDGNPLTLNTDYTSASGSTRTTLKASYLDTLSVGMHTLTVEFSSGIAPVSATFEILAAGSGDGGSGGSASGIPATGDSSLLPALLAGFLALVGVSLLGIASRRKNHVGAHRK